MNRQDIEKWFWSKVDRSGGPDACWPWRKGLDTHGYGEFWTGEKTVKATRFALALELGRPLLPGTLACHKPIVCHNPACCNPAHLYEGTQEQNMQDKKQDGTSGGLRGSSNPNSKLTEDEAEALLTLKGTMTQAAAGAIFGITGQQTGRIWRGSRRKK